MSFYTFKFLPVSASILLVAVLWTSLAQAQPVYRSVGADGKVTFSDKQPSPESHAKASPSNASSAGGNASVGLPFELRQVAIKYPVTLYTGDNCTPCGAGRSMLTSRGIPFTEKTVTTPEDAEALKRLSGENSLPLMTIGSQQLRGYSDSEWTQFLNAAGYPPSSALPNSYHRPGPMPLVAVATVPAAGASAAGATASKKGITERPARPVVQPGNNPAGIQF